MQATERQPTPSADWLNARAGSVSMKMMPTPALPLSLSNNPGEAEALADQLRARGLLVNVVDRPELCDFTTPAIVDRSPVLIAVSTGGASAGMAKALRQRIEAMLPAGLGALASAMASAREAIRTRWPDPTDRRAAIDRAFEDGGVLDPLADGASSR